MQVAVLLKHRTPHLVNCGYGCCGDLNNGVKTPDVKRTRRRIRAIEKREIKREILAILSENDEDDIPEIGGSNFPAEYFPAECFDFEYFDFEDYGPAFEVFEMSDHALLQRYHNAVERSVAGEYCDNCSDILCCDLCGIPYMLEELQHRGFLR